MYHGKKDLQNLKNQYGTKTITYFKNGFYKDSTNAHSAAIQYWRSSDTAAYIMDSMNSDTVLKVFVNGGHGHKSTYKTEINTDTILGYVCNRLTIKTGSIIRKYYYSNKLKLDAKYYDNYTYSNKNEIMNQMESAYLKLEIIEEDYKFTVLATEIKKRKLADSFFSIPSGKSIKNI